MCPMLTARFTPSASNRVSTGKGISRDGCAGSIETPNPGGITNSACRSVGPRPAQPSSLTDPTGFTKSKYDGYRLRVERDGDRVRLITRGGYDDLRKLPLSMRKTNLERLLARRPEGIFINPFERGEIGPDLFRAACRMGLEGLVSKRRERPYQLAGRSTGLR